MSVIATDQIELLQRPGLLVPSKSYKQDRNRPVLANDETAIQNALGSLGTSLEHLNEQLAFYGSTQNQIAEATAAFARETGGAITAADFASYAPQWVDTISMDYAGHTLHEIPPNGQGIAALIALGRDGTIVADFNTDGLSRGSADSTGHYDVRLGK